MKKTEWHHRRVWLRLVRLTDRNGRFVRWKLAVNTIVLTRWSNSHRCRMWSTSEILRRDTITIGAVVDNREVVAQ